MDRQRLEEFRQRLRSGQRVRVVNGQVHLSEGDGGCAERPGSVSEARADSSSISSPAGVRVKPHEWGAGHVPLYATQSGQQRALQEQSLLAREYPGFVLDIDDDGSLYTHGLIGPNEQLERAYHVLVLIPPGYGRGVSPLAYVLDPVLRPGAPHLFNDGSLCLDHSGAFTAKSTLLTFLAWVTIWLVLYEGWIENGTRW